MHAFKRYNYILPHSLYSVEDTREKFLRVYANVPDSLRSDIIAVVNGKTYSWNASYIEVKDDTLLGEKILKALEALGVL